MVKSTKDEAARQRKPASNPVRFTHIETALVIRTARPRAGDQIDRYTLTRFDADYGVGLMLTKADGTRYHINVDAAAGTATCDCPGHEKHGHCKHVDSLTSLAAAGKLTAFGLNKPAPAAPANNGPNPATPAVPQRDNPAPAPSPNGNGQPAAADGNGKPQPHEGIMGRQKRERDDIGYLADIAAEAAMKGAAEWLAVNKIVPTAPTLMALTANLKATIAAALPQALADAREATECGMAQIAGATFVASMRLAGINAAKLTCGRIN